jgi:hypothetical protein
VSRFHVDSPETAGEIVKIRVGATGVTLLLAALAGPVPCEFVAVTVNVYAVPLDNPVTTIGEDAPVPVNPPGEEVTVYPVIALEPTFVGAVKVTEACAFPPVAVPIVGAPGNCGQLVPMTASRTSIRPQRPYALVGEGKSAMIKT